MMRLHCICWVALALFQQSTASVSNSTIARHLRSTLPNFEQEQEDPSVLAVRKLAVDSLTVQRYKDAPKGQKLHPYYYSESYLPRATGSVTAEELKEYEKEFGSWKLKDSKASSRPKDDFYQGFPNRDVPRDKFPDTAWQVDKDYLAKFLPEAVDLTERAMEAILSEYGRGKKDLPDASFKERSAQFAAVVGGAHQANTQSGGWMPEASFKGLQRRLLHAVMTEDRFNVAMAGHSAAAGHGNHFVQSYTMQIQRILEPVLARLGVKSTARNVGMGGLGTQQVAMAAGDILGHDIDVVLWDSGMTEKDAPARGVLGIQSLLGCDRAPMLWFERDKEKVLAKIHDKTGADIATFGAGRLGLKQPTTEEEWKALPWAVQYLACPKELKHLCKERYYGKCWVDRKGFSWEGIDLSLDNPPSGQKNEPGGRASWHPGNREHQVTGRALTFPILQALNEALTMWRRAPDFKIEDSEWHVTDYYKNIKSKVVETKADWGPWCDAKQISKKFCQYAAKGRTENTPRARPWETSLRSAVTGSKHPNMNPGLNSYDPPDVYQPSLFPPKGEINVLAIIENGSVEYPKQLARIKDSAENMLGARFTEDDAKNAKGSKHNPDIKPGKGWERPSKAGSDNCDGEHDSFCGRAGDCLLYGHNDGRGGMIFDGFSGWQVFTLPNMEQGLVVIKMHSWAFFPPDTTKGWCSENDETPCKSRRQLDAISSNSTAMVSKESQRNRMLKPKVPPYCDEFKMEFAIDGKITSLSLKELEAKRKNPERVVEIWELYNDDDFAAGGARDVEFSLRITGCGRKKPFELTHIYWI